MPYDVILQSVLGLLWVYHSVQHCPPLLPWMLFAGWVSMVSSQEDWRWVAFYLIRIQCRINSWKTFQCL